MNGAAPLAVARTLYVFPVSHYCEKARWLLDAKGVRYETVNLLPGAHRRRAAALRARGTVPIYVERQVSSGACTVLDDSTDLALYLERTIAQAPLLPTDEHARRKVLEWEAYFDDRIGPEVRRWSYGALLDDHTALRQLFFNEYSARVRLFSRVLTPLLAAAVRRSYRVRPDTVKRARARIDAALDALETAIEGDPARYLVGDRFTLADLSAASLLAPLVGPVGTPWHVEGATPAAFADLRAELAARPAGRWIEARYRDERRRPAVQRP